MASQFRQDHTFEQRKQEAERMRQRYIDHVPVICEKFDRANIADIDKKKYLVPADSTFGQFELVIRRRLALAEETPVHMFIDETSPPGATAMLLIYESHKNVNGFVYLSYSNKDEFSNRTAPTGPEEAS